MKKLRVLVLVHEDLIPPDKVSHAELSQALFRTEYDVIHALRAIGHEVRPLGVRYELLPIRKAIEEWKPHIVFNLLEEFRDMAQYDQHVVSYLELLGIPYSGCNPRGLVLSRDKGLSKKILTYHRIRVPEFVVFPMGRKPRRPRRLEFPLIVKSLNEEASRGIAQASVVDNDEKLVERVDFIHKRIKTDGIAERFVPGRELYVSILGNRRLNVLPVWELVFNKKPEEMLLIATEKAKWDLAYQKKWGVKIQRAEGVPEGVQAKIGKLSKRIYRALGLSGYVRLDYRLSEDGELYFLEANPNPDIARNEEFASSAEAGGLSYEDLIQKILSLGLRKSN